MTSTPVAERYVAAVIDGVGPLADEGRVRLRARRAAVLEGGVPVERYRRLAVGDALALLAPPAPEGAPLR